MKVRTMDEFLNDEVMEQLIEEICAFDARAWSSIAMQLNLYSALNSVIAYPDSCPPVVVLTTLFQLMRKNRVLVEAYEGAVRKCCPATLTQPAHLKYMSDSRPVVPKHVSEHKLARQSDWPDSDRILVELSRELVACGARMEDLRRVLDILFFNRFVGGVASYESETPLMQFIAFLKFLRAQAYPLVKYQMLISQCASSALIQPAHVALLSAAVNL